MFGGTLVQIVKMMILIVVVLAKFIRSWWYSPSAGCRNTSTSSSSASARTSPTISRDLVQLYSSDGSSVQPCSSLGIRICSKAASRSVYPFFQGLPVYPTHRQTDKHTNHGTYITHHQSIQHVYLVIYWFAMSNAMYNPIIYCWMNARSVRSHTRLSVNFPQR